MNKTKNNMPDWALPLFSWIVSFYFLLGFTNKLGFPPSSSELNDVILLVFLWLFFLFLPFFSKIKIGKMIELEREITKTKEELSSFKQDIRNELSLISTSINTIGNLSSQVTVNTQGKGFDEGFVESTQTIDSSDKIELKSEENTEKKEKK